MTSNHCDFPESDAIWHDSALVSYVAWKWWGCWHTKHCQPETECLLVNPDMLSSVLHLSKCIFSTFYFYHPDENVQLLKMFELHVVLTECGGWCITHQVIFCPFLFLFAGNKKLSTPDKYYIVKLILSNAWSVYFHCYSLTLKIEHHWFPSTCLF